MQDTAEIIVTLAVMAAIVLGLVAVFGLVVWAFAASLTLAYNVLAGWFDWKQVNVLTTLAFMFIAGYISWLIRGSSPQ